MHLSSKPPFDHVAVMSECPPHLSAKMSLRVCITSGSLADFFLSLSSPKTISCCKLPRVTLICTHSGIFTPRRLSRLL